MNSDLRLRPAAGEMGEEARNGCDEDIGANNQEGRSELVSGNQAS